MKSACLGLVVWMMGVSAVLAQQGAVVRVRDLSRYVGQTVAVKGRTGNIVEAEEVPGVRVYTLRDDYGDVVHVRWRQDLHRRDEGYPIFGATYLITGAVVQESGRLYLDELNRRRMYNPVEVLFKYGLPIAACLLLGLLGTLVYVRRRLIPPPVWGYAEIVEGPQRGTKFALRGDEVWIGRETNPDRDICLSREHDRVSRMHGRLIREGNVLRYQDYGPRGTGSTWGSSVDGEPVPPGGTVELPPGRVQLNLGGQTTLLLVPVGETSGTHTGPEGLTRPAQSPDVHEEETHRDGAEPQAPRPLPPDAQDPDRHEGPTFR